MDESIKEQRRGMIAREKELRDQRRAMRQREKAAKAQREAMRNLREKLDLDRAKHKKACADARAAWLIKARKLLGIPEGVEPTSAQYQQIVRLTNKEQDRIRAAWLPGGPPMIVLRARPGPTSKGNQIKADRPLRAGEVKGKPMQDRAIPTESIEARDAGLRAYKLKMGYKVD